MSRLKTRIREHIKSLIKYRQYMMDNGWGANDMHRRNALEKVRKFYEWYENKDEEAHKGLVLHLQEELKTLMPYYKSRRWKLREETLNLIAYLEGQTLKI